MDWLVCQNGRGGRKEILLAQEEESFFVIYVYDGLTRDKRDTLERQGVSEELLEKLNAHYDKIPKNSIRGIGIGGYCAGDMVYLYPKSGKRMKFQLKYNHGKKHIDGFCENVERFAAPVDKKEKKRNSEFWRRDGRNQELYESLGIIVPIISIAGFCIALAYARSGAWYWFVGCSLFFALPVVLDILFPQYFTLIIAGKGKKSDALELSWTFFGVTFILIIMPFKNWLNEQWLWIAALLCGVVGALVMGLLAEEFRRKKEYLPAVFLVAAFLGVTLLGHANEVFDFTQPESYILEVEDLYKNGGRNSSYHLIVTLPDGREVNLDISRSFYNDLEVGDYVLVERGKGALGIEYANAYPVE